MDTPRYKELQEIYDSLHNERARIDTLIEMAMEVRNFDVDKAAVISDEVISRSEKNGYRLGKGRGLNLKGWCFWQQGEYDDGIHILQEALKVAQEINHKPLEARILNNFGY